MTKVPSLLACYEDLASGEAVEQLLRRYVKADVIVSLELFKKGVTLKQLSEFIQRRDAHIQAMLNQRNKKWSIDERGKVIVI